MLVLGHKCKRPGAIGMFMTILRMLPLVASLAFDGLQVPASPFLQVQVYADCRVRPIEMQGSPDQPAGPVLPPPPQAPPLPPGSTAKPYLAMLRHLRTRSYDSPGLGDGVSVDAWCHALRPSLSMRWNQQAETPYWRMQQGSLPRTVQL